MAGGFLEQPVTSRFDFCLWLDTDAYFPDTINVDLIGEMQETNIKYAFSHRIWDPYHAVRHFWDHTLLYMQSRDIDLRTREGMPDVAVEISLPGAADIVGEPMVVYNGKSIMADFQIMDVKWWSSGSFWDYFLYVDSMGGWWTDRWGDTAVRTVAVAMHLNHEEVWQFDLPYAHQKFCRCGANSSKSCELRDSLWICV
mmetsp:Transcript_28439/g.64624  ORF Transcript_28439/g.64624 Transcript_28439/m.64624 type:complete len:198 (+) Transcript_28439:1-594(+)